MPKDDKYRILLNACNVATQIERKARPYDAIVEAYNPDTRKFITRDPQYAQQIENITKNY